VLLECSIFVTPAKVGAQRSVWNRLGYCNLLFRLQSVSSSCGGRVTFLLCGQEKSNPKRKPPRVPNIRASSGPKGSLQEQHVIPTSSRGSVGSAQRYTTRGAQNS
jgi:hypothetical protein